jgi:hypothetical protein
MASEAPPALVFHVAALGFTGAGATGGAVGLAPVGAVGGSAGVLGAGAPLIASFCFLPAVCRAARVALALAAAATFFSGETTRGLRGVSPYSPKVSIEPANMICRACRTPETSTLDFACSFRSVCTAARQVALAESTALAAVMRACRVAMMSAVLTDVPATVKKGSVGWCLVRPSANFWSAAFWSIRFTTLLILMVIVLGSWRASASAEPYAPLRRPYPLRAGTKAFSSRRPVFFRRRTLASLQCVQRTRPHDASVFAPARRATAAALKPPLMTTGRAERGSTRASYDDRSC